MGKKRTAASHIELRHNVYYAVLYIPKDVVPALGKTKFYQTTRSGNKKIALERAAALVLGWKQQIAIAREESPDPVIASALSLREHLKTGSTSIIHEIIEEERAQINKTEGTKASTEFSGLVSGKQDPLPSLLNGWSEHQTKKGLQAKTIDQWHRDLELLVAYFRTSDSLTPEQIRTWITYISEKADLTASSVARILGACRNFYRYLKSIGQVPDERPCPFITPSKFKVTKSKKSGNANRQKPWVPFEPDDVVRLHRIAIETGKIQLADLIFIGAHTGARIEEICSMKTEDIDLKASSLSIIDSKTESGIRTIPIHKSLKALAKRLVDSSTDGYLLSGLTCNKYQDRSNAIGKAFGRLKNKEGFSERHVFHSIRKTFTTKLENLKVPENLAADIVGHEKPNITYGLYSGGSSLETMREVINKVTYGKWATTTAIKKPS